MTEEWAVAQIPVGPSGFPTVSASQLRTYGAGGFLMAEHEEARGCPRLWRAKYVEKRVDEDAERSYALAYGSMMHRILFRMENDAIGPEEALDLEFEAWMTPENYREALADLTKYLERGASPVDRFGTISTENELDAELYVDEEFGPIHFRGFVDWLGIDLDDPTVLRVVDYKSNRFPPSNADVRGDVQLKGYDWLVRQNWSRFMSTDTPRVVVHLDAIKWRDVEMAYTLSEIEEWHAWAVAVVRRMLRDEEHLPILNPGCGFCPVRDDCPAFQSLPETAAQTLLMKPEDTASADAMLDWRNKANSQRLLLEKAVKAIDARFEQRVRAGGPIETSTMTFSLETDWQDSVDTRALHTVLGDRFHEVITVGKGKLEDMIKGWPTDDVAAVRATISRIPVGSKMAKKKREK